MKNNPIISAPKEVIEVVNAITREEILQNVQLTLCLDQERYRDCIGENFLADMRTLYRLDVPALTGSIPLNQGFLDAKGVALAELKDVAKSIPYEIVNFEGMMVLRGKCGQPYGAAGIMDKTALKTAAMMLGGDYYILPSSIHEVILLPKRDAPDPKDLKKMVLSANEEVVMEKEWLSECVYKYCSASGEIEVVA